MYNVLGTVYAKEKTVKKRGKRVGDISDKRHLVISL